MGAICTGVHAHYHATRLTLAGLDDDAFTRWLTSARVEMNPHQVDAALFALKSPLSRGILLADEVGLVGHARPKSMGRYTHLDDEHVLDPAEQIGAAIERMMAR